MEPIRLTDKDVVLLKDTLKSAISDYLDKNKDSEELDVNNLAGFISLVIMDNIGVANKASVNYLKWLKDTGQI